jgi:hypothetical protein
MYRRILILCCVLCVSLMQSGCVGLIVGTTQECKREAPSTAIHDNSGESTSLPSANPTPSTKEEVREVWGKPGEIITVSENEETWIYKKSLWCGVIPVFFLPLPFILPVCEGFDKVDFRGNEATRIHTRQLDMYGLVVWLLPPGGFGGAGGGGEDCMYPLLSGPTYSRIEKIPDNAGLIYFYRQKAESKLGAIPYNVKTGGTKIATLYDRGYYPHFSAPNENEFCVSLRPVSSKSKERFEKERKGCVTINVKPGQTHYIKLDMRSGFLGVPNPQLVIVDSVTAEKEIADCIRNKELLTAN